MSKYTQLLQHLSKQKGTSALFKEKTLDALNWYRTKINAFLGGTEINVESREIQSQIEQKNITTIEMGHFYMFGYDPMNKKKLRYYDKFPLTLIVRIVPGGFLGLNMHYLDPIDRASFMDKLHELENIDIKDNSMKINITYDILKSYDKFRYYKACIKHYRNSHIKNFLINIKPQEWDIVLFLPTENFAKENKQNVWEISKNIIRKYRRT